jgi:hypothetical protein
MASSRANQLQKLADNLPGANQKVTQGLQQARQTQLQEQIKQAGPQAGTAAAQQIGAQQQAQSGQIQLGQAQKAQTQMGLLGQMGLEEQARGQRQKGFEQEIALSDIQLSQSDKLNRLSSNAKNQILDNQLNFQKNQSGQTLMNQRQLADWALTNARSGEEYAQYAQYAQQIHNRKLQMLETAHKKISQVLQQGYIKEGKPLDRALSRELTQKKANAAAAMAEQKNKAANTAAMFGAGGQILGAVAGSFVPIPGATMVGAAIGKGIGTAAAGLMK